jgi:hypothetical protein
LLFLLTIISSSNIYLKEYGKEKRSYFPLIKSSSKFVSFAALGHKRLYNDLAYFWLLQGLIPIKEEIRPAKGAMISQVQALLAHKPRISSFYLLSCFVFSNDYKDSSQCGHILEVGDKVLSENWLIPALNGFIYTFKLNRPIKGSFWYEKASQIESAPKYLKKISNNLLTRELQKDGEAQGLRKLIENITDENLKGYLLRFLKKGIDNDD